MPSLNDKVATYLRNARSETDKDAAFHVAISGGSMPSTVCDVLVALWPDHGADIVSQWHWWFVDERIVPLNDGDSTYGLFLSELSKRSALSTIKQSHIHAIAAPDKKQEVSLTEAQSIAQAYGKSWPSSGMQVALLGMGPDGHTASLFPGHRLLESTAMCDALVDSPKPPPPRVTMTFTTLLSVPHVAFIISGTTSKREIVKKVLVEKQAALPATMITQRHANLQWLLEDELMADLNLQ